LRKFWKKKRRNDSVSQNMRKYSWHVILVIARGLRISKSYSKIWIQRDLMLQI
jgi:hypothetical protein